jgi:hypothetical protein
MSMLYTTSYMQMESVSASGTVRCAKHGVVDVQARPSETLVARGIPKWD